jgi:UDP-2,4-diacetamido-2,4,6-trideoxy-beta-L-altropyranose hydrolase
MVGSNNPNRDQLQVLANSLRERVDLQIGSNRMADAMSWADLAISAAGSTTWELAFMGVPAALLVQADNQRCTVEYLHQHGIALNLGRHALNCRGKL